MNLFTLLGSIYLKVNKNNIIYIIYGLVISDKKKNIKILINTYLYFFLV